MEKQQIIQLKQVSKEFPGVKALTDINLEFYPGEVHALLGETGRGSQRLLRLLAVSIKEITAVCFITVKSAVLKMQDRP